MDKTLKPLGEIKIGRISWERWELLLNIVMQDNIKI